MMRLIQQEGNREAGRGLVHAGSGGKGAPGRRDLAAFTLVEYLICFFIATFTITTITTGYILAAQRTGYLTVSGAAQAALEARLEAVRGAQWDLYANPPVSGQIQALEGTMDIQLGRLRAGASDSVPATLTTRVVTLSPTLLRVELECVWSFMGRGPFTNRLVTYRAPDT